MNPALILAPPRLAQGWRIQLAWLGAVWGALLVLFHHDILAMAGIWWNSSTFNHILFLPFIIVWLVSLRWRALMHFTPAGWWPGLILVALGAVAWLLGSAAGVDFACQLGVVMMMQGAAIALLGPVVSCALAFPIFYALFLVPFGEELVPPLQTLTARMCMALLHLSGVPAAIEGVYITIPNGAFRVAEACSGVKFLVAMVALGALAANLCFHSWLRRLGFMAACVAAPILANGVRAFGTIWIAHRTSSDFAVGVDHVVYGWFFFAFVIALVMGTAWPFFDRGPRDPWFDADRLADLSFHAASSPLVALGCLAFAVAPLLWSGAGAAAPAPLSAPPTVPGWTRIEAKPATPWRPRFDRADHLVVARYRDRSGATVDLAIAVYADQRGREMIGYGQGAIDPDADWQWLADSASFPRAHAQRIAAPGGLQREVLVFYRVGDLLTGSESEAKLETMKVRLFGGPQRAVAILVSGEGDGARAAVERFVAALGSISALADRAAGLE
ncbi:MAG: EpsI domain-containing exosortase [Sphingomonas sanxanigenens]|uniref:EpsI domain-containing exosortase n=1 Tax=Sphingomonas sanxanigenens TaxID=397260 RepID=A0A2W5C9T0_9SPHN|nr:MAG: EpsI domain-containing exosortase [Sphingomonas sanxanigenens]